MQLFLDQKKNHNGELICCENFHEALLRIVNIIVTMQNRVNTACA
jgi:hypothetical protein